MLNIFFFVFRRFYKINIVLTIIDFWLHKKRYPNQRREGAGNSRKTIITKKSHNEIVEGSSMHSAGHDKWNENKRWVSQGESLDSEKQ